VTGAGEGQSETAKSAWSMVLLEEDRELIPDTRWSISKGTFS